MLTCCIGELINVIFDIRRIKVAQHIIKVFVDKVKTHTFRSVFLQSQSGYNDYTYSLDRKGDLKKEQ